MEKRKEEQVEGSGDGESLPGHATLGKSCDPRRPPFLTDEMEEMTTR